MKKIPILILMTFYLCSCSSALRYTSNNSGEVNNENEAIKQLRDDNIDPSNFKPLEVEYGIASYYADKYNGRKTASGEIYNMYGISAAHISYPMGTIVRVTNLSNNKSLIIPINDRMPIPDNGRVIDLSYGAAKKLDMIQSGTAKVKIEVIKWGKADNNN